MVNTGVCIDILKTNIENMFRIGLESFDKPHSSQLDDVHPFEPAAVQVLEAAP